MSKGITLCLLLSMSCTQEDQISFEPIEKILSGAEHKIHKGILTFNDQRSFDAFVSNTKNRTNKEWDEWEILNNFRSLARIHEEVIQAEDVFLNKMNIKYAGNELITRKDIGYTKLSQSLIDNGFLLVNDYETLDLNIPDEYYGRLLNKDGILRIGNDVHVPKRDFILIIKDGNMSKIGLAKTYKDGDILDAGVTFAKVTHYSNSNVVKTTEPGSRAQEILIQSCDTNAGGYRLIVYRNYTGIAYTGYSTPCQTATMSFSIRMRSLKKILGTWQNHNTSQWTLDSKATAEHYGQCPNMPRYLVATMTNAYNGNCPYGHTWNFYHFENYPCGNCESGGYDSCPDTGSEFDNPTPSIEFTVDSHNATGKGGTTCYVGAG